MARMDASTGKMLAVVTGASVGIGYELARELASHGFDLVIAAEEARIHEAAVSLREHDVKVESVQVDLATHEGVEQLYSRIQALGRPVEVLALNAGVGVSGDFAHTDLEAELNLLRLNVISVVHLTKRVLKDMTARGQGRLLFTSSLASTMPAPFFAIYAASKAFISSFAEAIRNELKDTGITVTQLLPGPTETEFFERAGMQDTPVGQGSKDDAAKVARQGVEAMMKGDHKVVAGSFSNKVQAVVARVLPDGAKAALHRRESEPLGEREESAEPRK